MTAKGRPSIECAQQHASVFVRDLNAAIEFYTQKLGFVLAFKWGEPPSFAGVNLDRTQIFLDQANGVDIAQAIGDRSWHVRDYTVRDPNGYHIVFGQHLLMRGTRSRWNGSI